MKGIILAGGSGSRLEDLTKVIPKSLLPVYDKPTVFYPLTTLIEMGITDILVITAIDTLALFKKLLTPVGVERGINLTFATQAEPKGIAEAFIIGEDFIGDDEVTLILGDNIFYNVPQLPSFNVFNNDSFCRVFLKEVEEPQKYGVASWDDNGNLVDIIEKPSIDETPSNFAVVGIYQYTSDVVDIAKNHIKPSERGELEITDINNHYIKTKVCRSINLPKECAWLDSGSFETLNNASNFVRLIQDTTSAKFGCPYGR